jgi:hypothetical protein
MAKPLHSTFALAPLSFTYATLFSFALLEQEKDETVSCGFMLLRSKPDGLKPAKARFEIPLKSRLSNRATLLLIARLRGAYFAP